MDPHRIEKAIDRWFDGPWFTIVMTGVVIIALVLFVIAVIALVVVFLTGALESCIIVDGLEYCR